MNFRILTNSNWKDENNVDQGYLHIEITTETDVWTKAERLPSAEVQQILTDPTALNTIATDMANRAVIARPNELAEEASRKALEAQRMQLELVQAQLELARLQNNG